MNLKMVKNKLLSNKIVKRLGVFAILPIPAWFLNYLVAFFVTKLFGDGNATVNPLDFIIVPSIIIFTTYILIFRGVKRKLLSHIMTPIHAFWGFAVLVTLPNEYNSYALLIIYAIGMTFLNFTGFWGTVMITFLSFTSTFIMLLYYDLPIGNDEILLFAYFAMASMWPGILNSDAQKRKAALVSMRKRLEEAHANLLRVDRDKTNFFQNISHELRTPLTLIMSPLDTISEKLPEDNDVKIASKNALRLYRLVNQLLDFQKISTTSKALLLHEVDLKKMLLSSSELFQVACKKKNVTFNVNLSHATNTIVLGDIDALEKIIFNYLSNALKFTPEHGRIDLILENENGCSKISVKDTGIGISRENQKKLFKIFSQVESNSKRDYEGTGIGLALAKELAHKMNGKVGVQSTYNFGCTFWLTIPVITSKKKTIDILIVDDESNVLSKIEKLIVTNSKKIKTYKLAPNATKAQEYFEQYEIKCILTDENMPGMKGTNLLENISQIQNSCRKIIFTGNANVDTFQKAINKADVNHILLKPWDDKELIQVLENSVEAYDRSKTISLNLDEYKPKTWHLADTIMDDQIETVSVERVETKDSRDNKLVLVIDDLPDMRSHVTNILEKENLSVISAKNGNFGLKDAKKHSPDLIIVDWMMPEMSGIDFLHAIKKDENLKDIPSIMLTAKSDTKSKLVGEEAGADAYISKPFDKLELVTSVHNILKLKDKEHEVKQLTEDITGNILKRFLPPSIFDEIISGKRTLEESQSKILTVVNIELGGFLEKSNEFGAKMISNTLNEFFEKMNNIIFENNGIIDRLSGNSIRAIFGDPGNMSAQDQVKSAIECSKMLQTAMDELNQQWKKKHSIEFKLKIGISHGPAIIGYIGSEKRSEYTAVGPIVETASKITEKVDSGGIFFTEVVRDLLDNDSWQSEGLITLFNAQNEVNIFSYTHEKIKKSA
jgi:signal transduction histidine kinase/DNA-binding response OmpR family regulator